ncbi:Hsp70 family protein [Actinomadura sp. 3N508]|uniref:Hsp70 family protein n=1 Tax=Actinomadura sp. 3N508 TaxID=3375153 RepID=UPI00378A49D5
MTQTTAIGIDLGTTNSAVALYDPDRTEAKIISNADGGGLTPSVVYRRVRDERESVLVGAGAVKYVAMEPRNTVVSVKRLMGRDFEDPAVRETRDRLGYEIVGGPDGDPRAHVRLAGAVYRPAQISSMILRKLVQDASRTLGREVTQAVITVPAYFRDSQRAATREAAEEIGLRVKKIIDEPTAAAIAFGLSKRPMERSRVLVYDLGGGTFDISILNTVKDHDGHGQFQVLEFSGDSWLGGDDFDMKIVQRIIDWVKATHGVDPSGDKEFLAVAKRAADEAKRQLNEDSETEIIIPAAYRAEGLVVDVKMPLTRDEFDEMIEPMVARTMTLVDQTLARQGLTPGDISDVLLVGGATLTRKVYESVEARFRRDKVRRNINPMECVALGAGILAGTLHGVACPACEAINEDDAGTCAACAQSLANARTVGDTGVHEVTGMSLGIAAVSGTQRDVFVPIIPRNTPYPLPKPQRQSFYATDSRLIRVPVYEGDDPVASRNHEQGVVRFELPREIDVNSRVDVTFNYTADRIVTVLISVPGTDMVKETTLDRAAPRTPPPAAPEEAPDEADDAQALSRAEAQARDFVTRYGEHMNHAQVTKINRDCERALDALQNGDSTDYRRLADILYTDLLDSGIASELLVAEVATNNAAPETGRRIGESIKAVQQCLREGRQEQAEEQARILKALVAKARKDRVQANHGAQNYDGLLKVMKGALGE